MESIGSDVTGRRHLLDVISKVLFLPQTALVEIAGGSQLQAEASGRRSHRLTLRPAAEPLSNMGMGIGGVG